eukprot:SAG11_NODE_10621_length_816_cov_1.649930_1_plen_185_part_01
MELDEDGNVVRRAAAFDDAGMTEPVDLSFVNQAMIPGAWNRVTIDSFEENWLVLGYVQPGVLDLPSSSRFVPLGCCVRAELKGGGGGGLRALAATLQQAQQSSSGTLYAGLRITRAQASRRDWQLREVEPSFVCFSWSSVFTSAAAFETAWLRDGELLQQYFRGVPALGWLHCLASADPALATAS